jgi:hypothetical protein
LAYANRLSVTPGSTVTITVGSGGSSTYAGSGSSGCVRIIWGSARSYPTTNIGDL